MTGVGIGVAVLLVLNLLRMIMKRRRHHRLILPATIFDTGVRSGYRTPGRRHNPHRGF